MEWDFSDLLQSAQDSISSAAGGAIQTISDHLASNVSQALVGVKTVDIQNGANRIPSSIAAPASGGGSVMASVSTGNAAAKAGMGIGTLALIGVGAYFLLKGKR